MDVVDNFREIPFFLGTTHVKDVGDVVRTATPSVGTPASPQMLSTVLMTIFPSTGADHPRVFHKLSTRCEVVVKG